MARKKKDSRKRQQRLQARRRKEKERQARKGNSRPVRGFPGEAGDMGGISPGDLEAAYVDPSEWGDDRPRKPGGRRRGRPRKPLTEKLASEAAAGTGRPGDDRDLPPHAIERSKRYRHWAAVCSQVRERAVDESGEFALSRLPPELRQWLYRARLRKLKGELRSWQVSLVDATGYDWTVAERKRKKPVPKKKRPAKKKKVPVKKVPAWQKWVDRVRQAAEAQGFDFFHLPERDLRRWLRKRRTEYRKGELRPEVKTALEAMGFDWERTEISDGAYEAWSKNLEAYREWVRRQGPGAVPDKKENYGLYVWFGRQRWLYRQGVLAARRKEALDAAGFPWGDRPAEIRRWWAYFDQLKAFHRDYGHAGVTQTDPRNKSLGRWLARQRTAYRNRRLPADQRAALDSLGVDPNPRPGRDGAREEEARRIQTGLWQKNLEELRAICRKEHGGRIPDPHDLPGRLERWLAAQRRSRRKGRLNERQVQMLDELGMVWDLTSFHEERWRRRYEALKRFVAVHGHTRVEPGEGNSDLAVWVRRQRSLYQRGDLRADRKRLLEAVGFSFELADQPTPQWMGHYEGLKAFRREHGHSRVPRQYPPNQALAEWAAQQKQRHKRGLLKPVHIELLEAVGFPWAERRAKKDRTAGR